MREGTTSFLAFAFPYFVFLGPIARLIECADMYMCVHIKWHTHNRCKDSTYGTSRCSVCRIETPVTVSDLIVMRLDTMNHNTSMHPSPCCDRVSLSIYTYFKLDGG